jgi:hypothetical protein
LPSGFLSPRVPFPLLGRTVRPLAALSDDAFPAEPTRWLSNLSSSINLNS